MACCLTRQANDDQCDKWAGVQEAELKLSSWGHGRNGGSDSTRGDRNSTEKVERTIVKSVTAQSKVRVGMQALCCCGLQQLNALSSQGVDIQGVRSALVVEGERGVGGPRRQTNKSRRPGASAV